MSGVFFSICSVCLGKWFLKWRLDRLVDFKFEFLKFPIAIATKYTYVSVFQVPGLWSGKCSLEIDRDEAKLECFY